MRILVIFTTILFVYCSAHAQKQDNVWCMGHKGGVDFNTSPPTPFESSIFSIEANASISDRNTGALLFYTDGYRIWNAAHNILLNGTGIGTDENIQTAAQGAVIVPFIDDEHKYYVFTISATGTDYGSLCYSVVDMTLDNGAGGVVPGAKKIKIGEKYTEGMIAMQGCGMVWLVTQQRKSGDFHAYKISASGIDATPVISPLTYAQRPSPQAGLKASPDSKRIASVGNFLGTPDGDVYIALQDFNAVTGSITNGIVIDTSQNAVHYGCEFSPNGKFLYVASDSVYQYDLSLSPPLAIGASIKTAGISNSFLLHGLQLRDDGNIYIVKTDGKYLDRISNCDARAPGCVYTVDAVEIGGTVTCSMPAKIILPQKPIAGQNTQKDVTLCNDAPVVLTTTNQQNLTWQDGSSSDSYTAAQAGIYWVRGYSADCKLATDTFNVEDVQVNVALNNDTAICRGDTIMLYGNQQQTGSTYLWSTGSTKDTIAIHEDGTYHLIVSYRNCADTGETTVNYHPPVNIDLGNDTELCKGIIINLPQTVTTLVTDKYLWQDSSTDKTFKASKPGKYFVTLYNVCKTITDTIVITERNCHFFFPSAFSPNGDGRNDFAHLVGDIGALTDFNLLIFNRWGEKVYATSNPAEGWDGNYKKERADLGVYFYMVRYKYLGEEELLKGDIVLIR